MLMTRRKQCALSNVTTSVLCFIALAHILNCAEAKRPKADEQNLDAALGLSEQKPCNAQGKFYDPTTRICEPYVDVAKWECSKSGLESRLKNLPALAEATEIDFFIQQKFEFHVCGESKESAIVILVQKRSPGEAGSITLVKKTFSLIGDENLSNGGATTLKETTLQAYLKTSCLPQKNDQGSLSSFALKSLSLQKNLDFTLGIQEFAPNDSTCRGSLEKFTEIKGHYSLGEVVPQPVGIRALNISINSVRVTLWPQNLVNQSNNLKSCGSSDWQSSVSKEVINHPSCVLGRNFAPGLFTIIRYEGGSTPKLIQLGDFESNNHSASSPENRSKSLAIDVFK